MCATRVCPSKTVLHAIKERGARATLAVLDASRRNPYERRFRSYYHGLAPVNAPQQCAHHLV